LLSQLEKRFRALETEKARLDAKYALVEKRQADQESLVQLSLDAQAVLNRGSDMTALEKSHVARTFISRIVVIPQPKRVLAIEICWRDNSSEKFAMPSHSQYWILWMCTEVDLLRSLIERKATQVEIAEALPNRNWRAIRIKAYEVNGKRSFPISPKPIAEGETYDQYRERIEAMPKAVNAPAHDGCLMRSRHWKNAWTAVQHSLRSHLYYPNAVGKVTWTDHETAWQGI
jgi:hypothetical protein